MSTTAAGRTRCPPRRRRRVSDAELDARALRIIGVRVNVVRRGERALLGIIEAGRVRDHAWLSVDQLDELAERATVIAKQIRGGDAAPGPLPPLRARTVRLTAGKSEHPREPVIQLRLAFPEPSDQAG